VIRLERVAMPAGLMAIAYRDPRGDLIIYVSDALDATCRRAAVRQAIRASRRGRWLAGLPPVGVALLAALQHVLRGGARALRAKPAALATAATALAAGGSTAAIFLTPVPHQPASPAPARPPVRSTAPARQPQGAPARHRSPVRPAAAMPSAPGGSSARPGPGRPSTPSKPPAGSAPAPSPARSPTPAPSALPSPSASPSPSPSGGNPGGCVIILGVRVCTPGISLSPTA